MCKVYPEDLIKLFGKPKVKKAKGASQLFEMETIDPNKALYEMYFKEPGIEVFTDEEGDEYILKRLKVATIRDVVNYVTTPGQTLMDIQHPGCVSFYNICEIEPQQMNGAIAENSK